MAPATAAIQDFLEKRYYCNTVDAYGNCYSTWNNWGRWVALAVVIVAFIILALLFSCVNNRRRRRRGMTPMYGTGWMGNSYGYGWGNKPPAGQQYAQQGYGQQGGYYNNEPYHGGVAAPPYSPPVPNQATGTTFNSNDGYYGQNAYELQQPQTSYQPQRGGDPVYDAPQGPPPKKGDGIIR